MVHICLAYKVRPQIFAFLSKYSIYCSANNRGCFSYLLLLLLLIRYHHDENQRAYSSGKMRLLYKPFSSLYIVNLAWLRTSPGLLIHISPDKYVVFLPSNDSRVFIWSHVADQKFPCIGISLYDDMKTKRGEREEIQSLRDCHTICNEHCKLNIAWI